MANKFYVFLYILMMVHLRNPTPVVAEQHRFFKSDGNTRDFYIPIPDFDKNNRSELTSYEDSFTYNYIAHPDTYIKINRSCFTDEAFIPSLRYKKINQENIWAVLVSSLTSVLFFSQVIINNFGGSLSIASSASELNYFRSLGLLSCLPVGLTTSKYDVNIERFDFLGKSLSSEASYESNSKNLGNVEIAENRSLPALSLSQSYSNSFGGSLGSNSVGSMSQSYVVDGGGSLSQSASFSLSSLLGGLGNGNSSATSFSQSLASILGDKNQTQPLLFSQSSSFSSSQSNTISNGSNFSTDDEAERTHSSRELVSLKTDKFSRENSSNNRSITTRLPTSKKENSKNLHAHLNNQQSILPLSSNFRFYQFPLSSEFSMNNLHTASAKSNSLGIKNNTRFYKLYDYHSRNNSLQ